MMKEICAQCLQPHKDPETGEDTYVFSCFNQDQPLDQVDFGGLASRLRQNSVQEKLTTRWISHCLKEESDRAEGDKPAIKLVNPDNSIRSGSFIIDAYAQAQDGYRNLRQDGPKNWEYSGGQVIFKIEDQTG